MTVGLPARAQHGSLHLVTRLPAGLIHQVGQRGWLESWSLAVVLGVAAGSVLAAAFGARRLAQRRGRRLPRVPRWSVRLAAGTVSALLALLAGAVAVNAYVGYVPDLGSVLSAHRPPVLLAAGRVGFAGGESPSRVVAVPIAAPRYGEPTHLAYVYLPPGYDDPANARRRYPVVYLIHGYPGRALDWFRAGRVQHTMDLMLAAHAVGPMIVVAPDANARSWRTDSECLNIPGGTQIESYLAYTVVDAVDRRFRTIADRAGRAIGGMSSGAFCALNVGLHHPHRFSVILASEPYAEAGQHTLHRVLHGDLALYRANEPAFYLPFWRFRLPVAVFLDAGSRDGATMKSARWLAARLVLAGQDVGLRIAPNQRHTWYVARVELPYALVFAWQHLRHMPVGGSDAADAATFARLLAYARTTLPLPPPAPQRLRPPGPGPASPSATPTATRTAAPSAAAAPARSPRPATTSSQSGPARLPNVSPTPSATVMPRRSA